MPLEQSFRGLQDSIDFGRDVAIENLGANREIAAWMPVLHSQLSTPRSVHITVHAQTNADPNQIAAATSQELRRQGVFV